MYRELKKGKNEKIRKEKQKKKRTNIKLKKTKTHIHRFGETWSGQCGFKQEHTRKNIYIDARKRITLHEAKIIYS